MKILNQFKMQLTARSSNESFARCAVASFISQLDPTLEEISDIKTAVSEAVTNCIVHAYPNSIGTITMKMRIFDDNSLEITIKDGGIGIPDIEKALTPLFTTGGDDRSGMGFTIMESFTDSMKVSSKPNKGTTVTMRKRISMRSGGRTL